MLRLEKLELRGFKSFCDATEILFHPGVTAIVGPNGCGKSNIVDAITWVLGEQSAKNLRGGKMEDVIFNGTRQRKPLGLAEVTLTFTAVEDLAEGRPLTETDEPTAALLALNEQEATVPAAEEPLSVSTRRRPRLPRLLAGEKITIGRRLYRSGDSDYLMNGRLCRLRDIQDFFSGTGLSRAHYAIIEQGRIGQVLSAKPQERRALIEEAAGIGRFKAKHHQTELKLEATRQNLARLTDLIGEIERSIANLKRQAQKSRRFVALREELRANQRQYLALAAGRLQAGRAALVETQVVLAAEHEQCRSELSRLAISLATAREAARQAEDDLAAARQAASAAERDYDRIRHTKANLEAELLHLTERDTELALVSEQMTERQCRLKDVLAQTQTQTAQLAAELAAIESELSQANQQHQATVAEVRAAETAYEQARQQHLTALTGAERLRHQVEQLTEVATRLARQRQSLEQEQRRAAERQAQAMAEYAAAKAALQESEQRLSAVRSELVAGQAMLAEVQSAYQVLTDRLAAVRRAHQRAEDRRQALEELDRQHAHSTPTVRRLFDQAADIPGFRPLGTLADFLVVRDGYESLVEDVLGEALQAVVVPTVAAAQAAANWLTTARSGRATLLITGVQGGANGTGAATTAKPESPPTHFWDVLGVPEHLAAAVRQAFPHLAQARVVSSLEVALEASAGDPARLFVTPTGEQVLGALRLTAGRGTTNGILHIKRELRSLHAEMQSTAQTLATLEQEQAQLAARQTMVRQRCDALDAELRQLEAQRAAQAVEVTQRHREVERSNQHLSVIAAEQRQLHLEAEQLVPRRTALEAELAAAVMQREHAERAVLAGQQYLTQLRPAVETAAQVLAELRTQAAGKRERHRAAEGELRRLEREWREVEQRLASLAAERARLQIRRRDGQQEHAVCVNQETAAEAMVAASLERVASAEAHLLNSRRALEQLDSEQQATQAVERDLREQLTAVEVRAAKLSAELDYLDRHCQAELGCTLETLPPADVSSAESEQLEQDLLARIANLKEAIVALGSINMLALEELTEAEDRYRFLTAQRDDVLESLAATEATLREIRQRTKARFREAFDHINAYFGETFQELFGGGRGEMLLIEPDDPLESGIEIVAQPPGKRLQSVLLLSGGEKAMAAMALILAIFRYRPSPFCVLDEVDAPLDEANIERFTEKVRAMSQHTQFLVVTHNKRTMEAADSIYGVTMPEPGVSKLLSVRFDDKPSVTPTVSTSEGASSETDIVSGVLGVIG
ncbi:MAG: chromosome segregation protein SMC [Acidobacteriota bacterium]